MNKLEIQFLLPCENPENNVRVKRSKRTLLIEVPINYPDFNIVSIGELLEVAHARELLDLSTDLNNKIVSRPEE